MSEQIDKIEAHIDQSWDQLPIYRFPKYLALFKTFASFEYLMQYSIEKVLTLYGYESRPIEMTHLRQGLQCIIPKLFEKCPDAYFNRKKISNLRAMQISYQESMDAIVFSQRYDWISYHFTGYRQKWFDCYVEGRLVQFSPRPNVDQAQSLLHHQIQALQDEKTKTKIINRWNKKHSPEEILELIKATTTRNSYEELLKNIPSELYEIIKYHRMATSSKPSIGDDIQIAGYTVKGCYDYWICFSILLSTYVECCKVKSNNNHNWFRNSSVLILTPLEISSIVAQYSGLSPTVASAITRDMVLDVDQQRPDVQIQPFVPLNPSEYVYVSPTLFATSNWEVCLLRRWAKKYPDEYGKLVASTKVKLSHELTSIVDTKQNVIAENRIIHDYDGRIVAEVDLAIFDRANRYLLISEIKWVIEADSFQEESHVHQDLRKGIEQLIKIQGYIENDAPMFVSQLFPNEGISIADIEQIKYALISKGSVDCGIDTSSLNIEVLDYQMTFEHLKTDNSKPLNVQFDEIIKLHHKMKNTITEKFEYNETDLAGFRFATPGFDRRGEKTASQNIPNNYRPKDMCYCGSGKKYKDCCQQINE